MRRFALTRPAPGVGIEPRQFLERDLALGLGNAGEQVAREIPSPRLGIDGSGRFGVLHRVNILSLLSVT